MLIVLSGAALIGGLVTAVVLWSVGPLIALAAAPFGASLLALIAAILLSARDAQRASAPSRRRAPAEARSVPQVVHSRESV